LFLGTGALGLFHRPCFPLQRTRVLRSRTRRYGRRPENVSINHSGGFFNHLPVGEPGYRTPGVTAGHGPDCRCFGQLHSVPAGSKTLVRNGVLAALAAFL
jgi:hypothetical protein